MPIFLDRHNIPDATSEDLERDHERDLAVQSAYDVKFLTYWFDPCDGTGICLVDAPNEEAILKVHEASHGNIPHEIIMVDLAEVEAFLGRTTDPDPITLPDGDTKPGPVDSALRAILFTDLKDSTTIMQQQGHIVAIQLLEQHDNIIENSIKTHDGRVVKHTGDGYMASFASLSNAVKCGIAIQRAFANFNEQQPKIPMHVRVGINAGLPIERGNDLFGTTVQLAARICNHAKPDQILVAGVVRELCEDETIKTQCLDAGRATLKGFVSAVQLYEVRWTQETEPTASN